MSNVLIRIGLDEVGRGCVFGPLVVGAVADLYLNGVPSVRVEKVRDSKTIKSEKVKLRLAEKIKAGHRWRLVFAHAFDVERLGVDPAQQIATEYAMDLMIEDAKQACPGVPIEVVLDGDVRSLPKRPGILIRNEPKADATVYEVSAASIVAKSARDEWVHNLVAADGSFARYDLDASKGYGNEAHAAAIEMHGLTSHHRTSFCRRLVETYARKRHVNSTASSN